MSDINVYVYIVCVHVYVCLCVCVPASGSSSLLSPENNSSPTNSSKDSSNVALSYDK